MAILTFWLYLTGLAVLPGAELGASRVTCGARTYPRARQAERP